MQESGTTMHHAASRLVIALQDASLTRSAAALRDVMCALHAITTACTNGHATYRVR